MLDAGQADSGPVTTDDLADFLLDNPDVDQAPTEDEEVQADAEDESADDSPAADEESDEDAEQQSSRKLKVTVKGEDGADTTLEVDEKELIDGYLRRSDYSRKTQELAKQEREITNVLASKHQEMQEHYTKQAQLARMAVVQLAGLKSPQEMAQLAQTDPSAWVQESQRAQAIQGVMAQIEQGLQSEKAKQDQQMEQARQAAFQNAWSVLQKEGFDRPKLETLYKKASETFGFTGEELAQVMDPKAVLVLRDALAYRELKNKKAEVTKQATKAAPLPAQRQTVPKQEKQMQTLNRRFSSGKAKLNDLAAFIANS
jgi:hypothetical protein